MKTNKLITDLDAIELSSGWNYNSKLVTGKNALLSDSLLRDIKVLSSNVKGDADMLEIELRAVINAMSQNEGKSVDALKNSTTSLKNNLTKLKEQLDKTTHTLHNWFIFIETGKNDKVIIFHKKSNIGRNKIWFYVTWPI